MRRTAEQARLYREMTENYARQAFRLAVPESKRTRKVVAS